MKKLPSFSKRTMIVIASIILIGGATAAFFLTKKEDNPKNNDSVAAEITSYEQCAAAGNPIQESFPPVCKTPDGKSFTKEVATDETTKEVETTPAIKCAKTETAFSDKSFGAAFCYPSEWGEASVTDAKVAPDDAGHREIIKFSDTTKFAVGGVSEDWSTTVGRDTACQEPSNVTVPLSDYNLAWHDIIGSGATTEFATRSLEVSAGGYDLTETVSNILDSGVCAFGHKVINGSRYKTLSAAFFTDFSDSAGIGAPRPHMDNPNVLFNTSQRTQLDKLLASIVAY